MKVFWSWQNDLPPSRHRHFIKQCLEDAVKNVGRELNVDERPELDHDTKDVPGMAEIAATILRKIADSAVFVADLTPLCRSQDGKALPNPNVLIELGWAMNKPGFDRIIGVINTAEGWKPDDLPFDIRHRKAMQYRLPKGADSKAKADARARLTGELVEAIRVNLRGHLDQRAAATEIAWRAANDADPSVWTKAKEALTYQDASRGTRRQVALVDKPRSYFRISPSGWGQGAPSIHEVMNLPNEKRLWAPFGSGRHGDCGASEEGYINLWFRSIDPDETENVLCYFEGTGEIWVVHGSVVSAGPERVLDPAAMTREWSTTLRSTLAFFDELGALPVRRVEVGVVKLKDVTWPERWGRRTGRKDRFVSSRQDRDWGEQAQLDFLTNAFNGVSNVFTLPPVDSEQVKRLIGR